MSLIIVFLAIQLVDIVTDFYQMVQGIRHEWHGILVWCHIYMIEMFLTHSTLVNLV